MRLQKFMYKNQPDHDPYVCMKLGNVSPHPNNTTLSTSFRKDGEN